MFLADRTAIGTILRLCVRLSVCNACALWLNAVFENTYFTFFFRFPEKQRLFNVFLKWRIKKS